MKKIVICIPMDEDLQQSIVHKIKDLELENKNEYDIVHIFKKENYPYMIPPVVYPDKAQEKEIKLTIEQILSSIGKDIGFSKVKTHCLFADDEKDGIIHYLKETKADKVISLIKEKHGISDYFSSTFTEYLVKHSPCHVTVLR